ncbi:enolase C-terminal domain-like protein [Tabrizicola sp.]|uniref:mandelate racemase/muconate lactonizing enzyme family protein n=1 Tax=Tabrizicola sp. TaxID=2005166 RepID=UPI002630225F|nr:enolase C-terminal domain-like protein [Tabrizicola sp.]MDM7931316.1 enolase C-terminal domain-like protein [Tabrizicola sp.]
MPRIEKAEAFLVDLVPKVRRTDAIQCFKSHETIFVTLTDAEDASGRGYSYTIGDGGPSTLALLRHTLLPALMGREAEAIEAIWRDLLFTSHATAVGPIMSLALAAIDIALWDLRGKRAGLPLHLLAGGAKTRVPMYSTEGGWLLIEPAALVDDAVALREAGFLGSRIKIGKPAVAGDAARLTAERAALGPDCEITTDANQSMTGPEAARRLPLLESLNIGWFEEPLPSDGIAGHARLARRRHLHHPQTHGVRSGRGGRDHPPDPRPQAARHRQFPAALRPGAAGAAGAERYHRAGPSGRCGGYRRPSGR